MDGTVLLKLSDMKGQCKLLTRQRDFDGVMQWVNIFKEELVEESKADEYRVKAIDRDPDLWVIEIENEDMTNLFMD